VRFQSKLDSAGAREKGAAPAALLTSPAMDFLTTPPDQRGRIMGVPQHWVSTLCFRQFRDKHTALGRLYWTYLLGQDAIRQLLAGKEGAAYAVDLIQRSFARTMLPETVDDLLNHTLAERSGIERVHLLALCSANLETYLQEAIRLHVANLGYSKGPEKLSAVGDALARPVVHSSTVPNMVGYIQEFLAVDLGKELGLWRRAYKMRCAAVHNGGFVTPRVLKDIPDIGLGLGDRITLDWPTLKSYLIAADQIAVKVDRTVASDKLRALEVEWFLSDLKAIGKLPPQEKVWEVLSQQWGVQQISQDWKRRIEKKVYNAQR
jgi:hypothetical protein